MILAELKQQVSTCTTTSVDFDRSVDVFVAGLGTAGAMAALCAAEAGASVLAVERSTMSGGTGTAGGISSYYYGLPGGRFEKVDERANELQLSGFIPSGHFHPDCKSMALEEMLESAGASLSYDTSISGVYLDEKKCIRGVKIIGPEGVEHVGCKVLLDATGEGQVCAMAGASYSMGRSLDGLPQPFSSVRVSLSKGSRLKSANFDAGYARPNDNIDMSTAMLSANAQHRDSDRPLQWITTIPGTRQGRLIDCDTQLRFEDYMAQLNEDIDEQLSQSLSRSSAEEATAELSAAGRKHEGVNQKKSLRTVAYAYSNFDSHSRDWAFEGDMAQDWMVVASLWGKNFTFPVPLESMIVKDFTNLMAIGRCFGVDHIMACALRMQRCMQKLAEAAGMAAATAAQQGCDVRDVDRDNLIGKLQASGCYRDTDLPDCRFEVSLDTLPELLASEAPGEAIWALSRQLPHLLPQALTWLRGDNEERAINTALALSLAGYRDGMSRIESIVIHRMSHMPKSSRAQNQNRLWAAIYLLGKDPDPRHVDILITFLDESLELDTQEVSHGVRSLIRLGEELPDQRSKISHHLDSLTQRPGFESMVLILKNSSSTGDAITSSMGKPLVAMVKRTREQWGD